MESAAENTGTKPCPSCGKENPVNEKICYSCGETLGGNYTAATRKLKTIEAEIMDTSRRAAPAKKHTHFPSGTLLALQLRERDEPLVYSLDKGQLLVGRRDTESGYTPDVDLYSYAGFLLGVSRKHAIFHRISNQLVIEDLGSANGTYVDGKRLPPNSTEVLYRGAEVRLGDLHFTINF